jgi:peptide/nickel transport system substrate-binding protein
MPLNTRDPKLADRRTRQALSCLMDYDRGLKDVQLGYAERVVGPVHPTSGAAYNDTLELYRFDPQRAASLLAQAGWTDSDGNGVLDAMIAGHRQELRLEVLVNSEPKSQVALILQKDCERAGVIIDIKMVDGLDMNERLKNHEFEIAYTALFYEQAPTDFMQQFGTQGWDGGDNYTYFGTASTDSIITKINLALDEDHRAHLIRQLQEVIHYEAPFIFLWSPLQRLAVNKRFSNTNISVTNPGYWVPGFVDEGEDGTAED